MSRLVFVPALLIALISWCTEARAVDRWTQSDGEKAFIQSVKDSAHGPGAPTAPIKSWDGAPRVQLPGWGAEVGEATVLSEADAQMVYRELKNDRFIAWDGGKNFCNARAHEAARVMNMNGIQSAKIFVSHVNENDKLRMSWTVAGKYPTSTEWDYHVAAVVLVKGADGKLTPYALDPSTQPKAVPVETWIGKMIAHKPNMEIRREYRSNQYYTRGYKIDGDPFGPDFLYGKLFKDLGQLQSDLWSFLQSKGVDCNRVEMPKRPVR